MPTALQYINQELKKFFGTKLFDLKTNGHNFIIASSLNLAGTENDGDLPPLILGILKFPKVNPRFFLRK